MLEQGVELHALEGAPGAVQVLPGRGLLAGVLVVEEPAHTITLRYCTTPHISQLFHNYHDLTANTPSFSDVVLLVLTTFSF